MNKWIYSSVTLNIFSLFCLVYFLFFLKSTAKILIFDGNSALDFLGFGYFPQCFKVSCILLLCYVFELIIHFLFKKISFSFPIHKIQNKKLYYIFFYCGFLIGTGFLICLISVIPIFLIGPIYNKLMLHIF